MLVKFPELREDYDYDNYKSFNCLSTFEKLVTIPGLVQFCKLCLWKRLDAVNRGRLEWFCGVKSLEVVYSTIYMAAKEQAEFSAYFKTSCLSFDATRLSIKAAEANLGMLLLWISRCFPNLQHLYIHVTLGASLLPLKGPLFPKLSHFYSNAPQKYETWSSLRLLAPGLLYLYCDHLLLKNLTTKAIHDQFIVGSFQTLRGEGVAPKDISGFNASLFD